MLICSVDITFAAESKMKYTYYTSLFTFQVPGIIEHLAMARWQATVSTALHRMQKTSSHCNYLLSEL